MVARTNRSNSPEVWIFVEGGGNSRDEQSAIKFGFAKLVAKVLGNRAKPTIIPSGGRDQAYRAWERALRTNPDKYSLLLVDSEAPILEGMDPWEHVSKRVSDTHWSKPGNIDDERLFFMVQTMEAWFIADKQALVSFYGSRDFQASALPDRKDVENIPKKEIEQAIARASRNSRKGSYKKSHGFEIIGLVDAVKVRNASPHAARFFDKLLLVCPVR